MTDWLQLEASQLCTGSAGGGRDGCRGDSGGPLTLTQAQGSVLAGIISAGWECGRPGVPALYTRLSSFSAWLRAQVDTPV